MLQLLYGDQATVRCPHWLLWILSMSKRLLVPFPLELVVLNTGMFYTPAVKKGTKWFVVLSSDGEDNELEGIEWWQIHSIRFGNAVKKVSSVQGQNTDATFFVHNRSGLNSAIMFIQTAFCKVLMDVESGGEKHYCFSVPFCFSAPYYFMQMQIAGNVLLFFCFFFCFIPTHKRWLKKCIYFYKRK